jgi:hypothetical protein
VKTCLHVHFVSVLVGLVGGGIEDLAIGWCVSKLNLAFSIAYNLDRPVFLVLNVCKCIAIAAVGATGCDKWRPTLQWTPRWTSRRRESPERLRRWQPKVAAICKDPVVPWRELRTAFCGCEGN